MNANKSKLKIAFFIDAYQPGAGTENQLRGLLQNLDPNRIESIIFTLRREVAASDRIELPCSIECLHVGKLLSIDAFFKFVRLVFKLRREKYDIVSIYFNDSNLFVVPACFLAGVRNVVINKRNIGYDMEPGMLRWLTVVNKLSDFYLANSHAVKEHAARTESFPKERICVIYNGLWEKNVAESDDEIYARLGVPRDVKLVGMVANLRRVKRVDRFIEVARVVSDSNPETHFLIVGKGDLEDELRRQVELNDMSHLVHFAGSIDDVSVCLRLFHVGVLTSESEGLSNALIEYADAGVPAVVFDVGGNNEVVEDGVTGEVVKEMNIEKMAVAICHFLDDEGLRSSYSAAARERARQLFSAEETVEKTQAFFESITGGKRKNA